MKSRIKIFSIIVNILLIIFIVYLYKNPTKNIIDTRQKDAGIILQKLIESSSSKITHVNCEIFRENKLVPANKLKVSDFISNYLYFLSLVTSIESSLTCGQRSKNECSLAYISGSDADHTASSILFFKYNPSTKTIEQNSFACIDIP